MKRIFVATLFMMIVSYVGYEAGSLALFAFSPTQRGSSLKDFIEVRKGQGPADIGKVLLSKNAIGDLPRFIWLGRLTRQWKRIKAGEYEVSPAMTPIEILATITSGISVKHPITVREGENMYEIAADLAQKSLASKDRILSLCKDRQFMISVGVTDPKAPSLEGYLYPETYFLNRAMTPEEILRLMVKKFMTIWTSANEARAAELKLTQHQVVTLASIIEKETGAQAERPLISSVFHNRLRKRMRLQSDPTTIYGIWETYKGNIHRSDLLNPTPYNTYTVAALPIGPISNPGKAALSAALYPSTSEYLFFVSHNDGTHEFTRSLADHNRAVQRFQIDPKAREGKSWRDLPR